MPNTNQQIPTSQEIFDIWSNLWITGISNTGYNVFNLIYVENRKLYYSCYNTFDEIVDQLRDLHTEGNFDTSEMPFRKYIKKMFKKYLDENAGHKAYVIYVSAEEPRRGENSIMGIPDQMLDSFVYQAYMIKISRN